MQIKECKHCGKQFEASRTNQIYCSKECNKQRWYKKKLEKIRASYTSVRGKSLLDWCNENGERGNLLLSEYSFKNELSSEKILAGSEKKVYWVCSTCGYEWEAMVANRTKLEQGCPSCAGHVIETNNLYLWCMENGARGKKILDEYSFKNDLSAEEITSMSGKKVIWECSTCGYAWEAIVSNRTSQGQGCPYCAKTSTSYGEQILYYILQRELKEHKVLNRAKVEGYEVDVFVSDLKFGIEYSGYTYHADKVEQDKIKREALKDAGYNVITILEKKSTDGDLDCDFCIIRSGILDPDEMLDYLKSYMKENYNLDIDVSLSVDEKEVCKQNSTKDYIDIDEVVFVKLFQKTQNKCGEVLGIAGHAVGNKLKELSEKEYAEKVDNIIGIINISRFGDTAEQIATDFELDLDFVKKIQSYIKKYSII